MLIRSYITEDREAVIACLVEFQEYERAMEPDWKSGTEIAEPYLDYLLENVKEGNGRLVVAEVDGGIVGYVAFWIEMEDAQFCQHTPSHVRLCDLFVKEQCRKGGIGRALTAEVEKFARDTGQTQIKLDVLARSPARSMYERIGFRDQQVAMVKEV